MNNTNRAWSCPKCHAVNVGAACGCHPTTSAIDTMAILNSITLSLPVKKARK